MRSVLRIRRTLASAIALVVGLISLSLPTLARDAGKGDPYLRSLVPGPLVSDAQADDIDLQQALSLVLRKAGVNYVIHPDVPLNKVTLGLHNVPLHTVLKLLCKRSEKPISFDNRHGVYRIFPVPGAEPGGWKEHSGRMWVNLGVKNMRLGVVLSLIMEQFGQGCSVDGELSDRALTITMNQPYEVALETLQKASGAQFHIITEGRMTHFLPVGKEWKPRPFYKGDKTASEEKRVTLDWDNIPLGPPLRSLMRQFKTEYDLHPALKDVRISIRMEDVTLAEVLRELGKASSLPFTYEVKNGVYRITPIKK